MSCLACGCFLIGSPQAQEPAPKIEKGQTQTQQIVVPELKVLGTNKAGPIKDDQIKEQARTSRSEARAEAELMAQKSIAQSNKSIVQLAERQLMLAVESNNLLSWTFWATFAAAFGAVAAAGAAIYAVADNKETNRRTLRAYLHEDPADAIAGITQNPVQMTTQIINVGKTPAHNVYAWSALIMASEPLPVGTVFPDMPKDFPQRYSVFPGGKHFNTTTAEISNEERIRFKKGEAALYYVGETRYQDIFGDNHFTRIRVKGVVDPNSDRWSWTYTKEGNYTDDVK
jgi:hypothetical protein